MKKTILAAFVATTMVSGCNSETVKDVEQPQKQVTHEYNKEATALLRQAVKDFDNDLLKKAIQMGADVNARDKESSWTPLMRAIYYGKIAIINTLLAAKADVNLVAENGELFQDSRVLELAINYDGSNRIRAYMANKLIRNGANPNNTGKCSFNDCTSPLMVAVSNDQIEIARSLIRAGADINFVDYEGKNALSYLNYWDRDKNFERIRDDDEQSKIRLDIAKLLLDNGADINKGDHFFNSIDYLDNEYDFELFTLFLNNSADVNATDQLGSTPLMIAVSEYNYKIGRDQDRYKRVIKNLIYAGADLEKRKENGETALMRVAKEEMEKGEVIYLLVKNGADINAINPQNGKTVLDYVINSKFDYAEFKKNRLTKINILRKLGAVRGNNL